MRVCFRVRVFVSRASIGIVQFETSFGHRSSGRNVLVPLSNFVCLRLNQRMVVLSCRNNSVQGVHSFQFFFCFSVVLLS